MPNRSLKALFGGIPFLDETFRPESLLAAIAVVRRTRLGCDSMSLQSMLSPDSAVLAAGRGATPDQFGLRATPLSQEQSAAVAMAQTRLAEAVPHWKPLTLLPVRIQRMQRGEAISASVDSIPQHFFLGDDAFASPAELREQVLHELSHNWLYLIAEIWPLYDRRSKQSARSALPSGTPDRSPAEVIGAAHVVVNILNLHQASPYVSPDRKEWLQTYLEGCTQIVDGLETVLTPTGIEIAERIRCSSWQLHSSSV